MINRSQKLTPIDSQQLLSGNNAVLALKFDNNNVIKEIIEKMKDEVLGLNLKIENNSMVQKKKENIIVHQLPPSSNFKSIQQMTEWAAYKYIPNIYQELGTIAANDDTIILHLNHPVSDGKYIAGLCRHIGDKPVKIKDSYFPITFDEEFTEEIKERLKKPPKFFQNDVNYTKFKNFGMKKISKELLFDDIYDTKSFSNYNPIKKTCHNLTAAIVTGYSLSLSALDNQSTVFHLGGSMSSNMRNILREKKLNHIPNLLAYNNRKPKIDINKYQNFSSNHTIEDPITNKHANFFTVVPISAPVTPYTKIDECYKRLNKRLKSQFNETKEDLFDFRCSFGYENPKISDDGIMICFSHLGPIYIRPPVTDLYLFNLDFNIAFPEIILLTYSIIDERKDRNEFHSQVRYGCNGLTEKQAKILSKSLEHYLQTCNVSSTIGEAFDELKKFQKNISKF